MTLSETESVCPVCLKTLPARIVLRGKEVFMEKTCPEHGMTTAYLWPDVEHYHWMESFRMMPVPPRGPIPSRNGCPEDCGLCQAHRRHPVLVELEVTQRCNLRCPVCFMAAGDARGMAATDPDMPELKAKFQSILDKAGPLVGIQLTGGEPTVRQDLPEIVRLARETGFDAVEVNTNGLAIAQDPKYIRTLSEAGISGVFLQFDGVTDEVYHMTRGAGLLETKLRAIENCRKADVQVVLAMTVIEGTNEEQIGDVLRFALDNRDVIAGIAYQPAFGSGRFDVAFQKRLTMGDVILLLAGQSEGLIEPRDLWPLGCSHPLCSSSTYLIEHEDCITPFTRLMTPEEYATHFNPDSPQGSILADIAHERQPELMRGLSIVIMNYMDAWNLDLCKLRECSMTVAGCGGSIAPFCAYHLTDSTGNKKEVV